MTPANIQGQEPDGGLFGMSKLGAILLAVVVVAAMVAGVCGVLFFVGNIGTYMRVEPPTYEKIKIDLPRSCNPRTMAVFNFRPRGDADASAYGIGFARALSDRLCCAPRSLVMQMSATEISNRMCMSKIDIRKPVPDSISLKLGKKMAVKWVVTGDLELAAGQVKIAAKLTDLSTGKSASCKVDGTVAALPELQTELAKQIVNRMGIEPAKEQQRDLAKPNFTKPESLLLYGRSYAISDLKQCQALRWKALDGDQESTFIMLRLLEFYTNAGLTIPEIESNKRLAALVADSAKRYAEDSHFTVQRALLLANECRLSDAQSVLEQLVRDDPDFIWGHTALGWVARYRMDSKLSVVELKKAVDMWPNNAYLHAKLAEAYGLAAWDARREHYLSHLGWARHREWKENCDQELREAATSVRMDPDCWDGWNRLMSVSVQLGRCQDRDRGYRESVRLAPCNLDEYSDYMVCFLPQWGGSQADRDAILQQAERAFGKDSPEVYALRARTVSMLSDERDAKQILSLVNDGLKRCKTPSPTLLRMKSQQLMRLRKLDEAEAIAVDGAKRWNTFDWRLQLAHIYCVEFEQKHDPSLLAKAAAIYKDYEKEVPFDTTGYLQWGWCLSHQGNRAAAKAQFEKGLPLDPQNEVLAEKMKYVE